MSESPGLSIGKATELLQEEFPGLTMSKVRFLETRGLIVPSRTSTGYRQYRTNDIERLRFILRRQRDQFLPLKVIKSQLVRWDRGELADPDTETPDETSNLLHGSHVPIYDIRELVERAGISRSDIRQLNQYGLLAPEEEDGALRFTDRDVEVSRHCKVLLELGLEPRHLRTIRNMVGRQVDLIDQLTIAHRRNRSPEARRQAREVIDIAVEAMRMISDALYLMEAETILGED